jgi:hypothetical protein
MIGIVALAIVVLSASFAAAQSETASTLVINPQIGVNGSTLSGNPEGVKNEANVGWQIGGYLRYGKRFYIQPGIFWHYMSTETTSDVNDLKVDNKISTIQVPVCIGFNIVDSSALVFRAFAGAAVSFLTSVDEGDYIKKDDINSTQWLGRIGVGLDFTMFTVDLGYDYGFSSFYSDETIEAAASGPFGLDVSDVKIQEFFLNFGLKF